MARTEKQFDAVQMMRSIRDRISGRDQGYDVRGGASLHPRGLRGRLYPASAASAATAAKSGQPRRMKERR